jgi:hypothetical protein
MPVVRESRLAPCGHPTPELFVVCNYALTLRSGAVPARNPIRQSTLTFWVCQCRGGLVWFDADGNDAFGVDELPISTLRTLGGNRCHGLILWRLTDYFQVDATFAFPGEYRRNHIFANMQR